MVYELVRVELAVIISLLIVLIIGAAATIVIYFAGRVVLRAVDRLAGKP